MEPKKCPCFSPDPPPACRGRSAAPRPAHRGVQDPDPRRVEAVFDGPTRGLPVSWTWPRPPTTPTTSRAAPSSRSAACPGGPPPPPARRGDQRPRPRDPPRRPDRVGSVRRNGDPPAIERTRGLMDLLEALYTTRRDAPGQARPHPLDVQRVQILDAAVRAPQRRQRPELAVPAGRRRSRSRTGSRPSTRTRWAASTPATTRERREIAEATGDQRTLNVLKSSQHLADHFAEYPLLLFAFTRNDPSGGSIFPSVWSAQLAARGHGVGTALTTVLGLFHGAEAMKILGVPEGKGWELACTVTFGYPTGRWGGSAQAPGPRGELPQPVGRAGRLRDRRAAVELPDLGVVGPGRDVEVDAGLVVDLQVGRERALVGVLPEVLPGLRSASAAAGRAPPGGGRAPPAPGPPPCPRVALPPCAPRCRRSGYMPRYGRSRSRSARRRCSRRPVPARGRRRPALPRAATAPEAGRGRGLLGVIGGADGVTHDKQLRPVGNDQDRSPRRMVISRNPM